MSSKVTEQKKVERRGRRHLDGSAPGKGVYSCSVAVALRPFEIEMLEQIGEGNRSVAIRRLLEMYRASSPEPATVS